MDDDFQNRRVRVPKGTHLSESRASDGAQRDLLREDGTNNLLGPAESFPLDADALNGAHSAGPTVGQQLLATAIQAAAQALAEQLAEVDWDAAFARAAVALRRTRGKIAKRLKSANGRTDSRPGTDMVAVITDTPDDSLEEASPVAKVRLSSAEYRERVMSVLAADRYAAWQTEILSNAVIEDDETSPELLSSVKLVLEGRASSLDEAELAAVIEYLRDSQATDGAYLLPRGEARRETPKPITGGETPRRNDSG